ncbi:MAG: hypothetical protein O3C57_03295 [Verrucomicrobia bacterium]|nr:hypothetical protein [Verrucomicrobiota bacterium]
MSDDPILQCPSCGARLKIKAASMRALKEVTCARCRAKIPTASASVDAPAPERPALASVAAPIVIAPSVAIPKVAYHVAPAVETVNAEPVPVPGPTEIPKPVAPPPAPPMQPVIDHALTNRVASLEAHAAERELVVAALEARLTDQDNAIAGLRMELARLRECGLAAARLQVSTLESA